MVAHSDWNTEDACSVVDPPSGALAQFDFKVGFSAFIIGVIWIVEFRAVNDKFHSFADFVYIGVEINGLDVDLHVTDG